MQVSGAWHLRQWYKHTGNDFHSHQGAETGSKDEWPLLLWWMIHFMDLDSYWMKSSELCLSVDRRSDDIHNWCIWHRGISKEAMMDLKVDFVCQSFQFKLSTVLIKLIVWNTLRCWICLYWLCSACPWIGYLTTEDYFSHGLKTSPDIEAERSVFAWVWQREKERESNHQVNMCRELVRAACHTSTACIKQPLVH